jgi:tRNA pseudouridine13 synthase
VKRNAEDFLVDEELAYAPSGEGEHLFIRFQKKNLTTEEAVRRLAGKNKRDAGIAGYKDKHGITTQWISIPLPLAAPIPAFEESDDLVVLEAKRHVHKLRRGHARANRFRIVVRGVDRAATERAEAKLEEMRRSGVPNRFGAQRFGIDGDNAERALAFIRGEARAPRDRRVRDLLISALQSKVFNRIVELRMARGLWMRALVGDVMVKHATGGMFTVADAEAETLRVERLEISPTGLLPGRRTEIATELEREAIAACGLVQDDVEKMSTGTRRALRYPLDPGARIERVEEDAYRLEVTLPSGAFATVVLDELAGAAPDPPGTTPLRDEGSSW